MLDRLCQAGLHLRKSKCLFFQQSLEYLGHVISKEGIRPTNERVKCVRGAPPPQNKQQLQPSFFHHYHVLHPWNSLLRKNVQWKWSEEEQKSFEAAKSLVSDRLILAHYDVLKPLKLYCDASPKGV